MLSKEQLEGRITEMKLAISDLVGTEAEEHVSAIEDAISVLTELLSLREQLEALKRLPAVAVLYRTGEVITRAECADDRTFDVCCKVETPLFTAAKPADSVILPAPANYEDYGPMISLEKTMAALALCGIEYTVRK